MTKSKLQRKGFAWLPGYSSSLGDSKVGTKGINQKEGTEEENMMRLILVCPPCLAQLPVLYWPGPPTQEWYCPHLIEFLHMNEQFKCSTDLPKGQSGRDMSFIKVLSFQMCQV